VKKLRLSYEKKKGIYGYGFIALWFFGSVMFFIVPIIKSFYYSFNDVRPEVGYLSVAWVGVKNYANAFMVDPYFRQYLAAVLLDVARKVPVIIIFSMFAAIIINQEFKGRTFARAAFFLPVIIATGPVYAIITGDLDTSGNAGAEQFSTMFEANMVDQLLEFLGVYGFGSAFTEWLTEITSGILNLVWNCGVQIIIFLAALQGIPSSAKEVAAIEGATGWEFFWKITLPYVSPMILVNIIYTVIDTFKDPTNPVMNRILNVQSEWRFGASAAMAWRHFGIILAALAVIFFIVNKFAFYEGDS